METTMGEVNGSGKPLYRSGAYKHKETGKIVWLDETPGIGTPTIDAFIQVGFVKCDDSEFVVISQPDTEEPEYTEMVTKTGAIQYRKNGKLISKEKYENK